MSFPFVSVIIPVYNDPRLDQAVAALLNQTYPPDAYEIIIADNGSRNDYFTTLEKIAQQSPDRIRFVVENEIQGSYAARNKGLEIARGEIIAFTDSDCIPATDWLAKGVARLVEGDNCGLLAGRIELFYQNPASPTLVELYESAKAFRQEQSLYRDHFGVTANLFTYRAVIDQVGPFDGQLQSGGDFEWGQRVYTAGYRQRYAGDVLVHHPARRTIGQLRRKIVRITEGGYDLTIRYGYRRYGLAYVAKWLLFPPYQDINLVLRKSGLKGWTRFRLILLCFLFHYVHVWTVFRLTISRIRHGA